MPGIEAPSAFGAFQKGFNKKLEGKEVAPIEQAAPESPPADRYAAEKAAARQLEALFAAQNAQQAPQAPMDPELAREEELAVEAQAQPEPMLSPVAAPVMQEALGSLQKRAGPRVKPGMIR